MMTRFGPFWWLVVDYYALATCLLLAAALGLSRLRQPVRRLAVAWAALVGLTALLGLVAVPAWPRVGLTPWSSRPRPVPPAQTPAAASARASVSFGPAGPRPEAAPSSRSTDLGREPARAPARPSRAVATAPFWATAAGPGLPAVGGGLFFGGMAAMLGWLALGAWQTRRVRARAIPAPVDLRLVLARVVGGAGVVPDLLISAGVRQPVAVGTWRPTIILPRCLVDEEAEPRLEVALAHEWAHIQHRDLWLVALIRGLLPILYAHPAYWWLRRRVRDDQEALADAVASRRTDPVRYAEVLLAWSKRWTGPVPFAAGGSVALFERPSQIKWRIVLLLNRGFDVEATCPRRWRFAVRGLAVLAVLGLSALTFRPLATGQDQPPASASTPATASQPEERSVTTIQLLDPAGKPFAGATVHQSGLVLDRGRVEYTSRPVGTTDQGGSCALPGAAPASPSRPWDLILTAEGYGPAFFDPETPDGGAPVRLVRDDVPIQGRILDIQGRPVAGATVQVVGVLWHPSGKLDAWLAELQAKPEALTVQYALLRSWASDINPFYPPVVADRQGRFTIRGVGRERIASLLITGPGIATRFEYVATRPMPTLKVPAWGHSSTTQEIVYHGAEFDLIAGPGAEVGGTVTDQETGQPLAGVRVQTAALFGNPFRTLNTTTDAQGRYRLPGIPPKNNFNDDQALLALVDDGPPYVPTIRSLGTLDVVNPTAVNLVLRRGVRVRGRVFDRSTGKGVRAGLEYFIMPDNPALKTFPRYGTINAAPPISTADDGTFQLAVLPGRGVLGARAGNEHYLLGSGSEAIPGASKPNGQPDLVATEPHYLVASNYHTVVVIDPQPGAEVYPCDIGLDRGKAVSGSIVGPDGAPLAGAWVEGLQDRFRTWTREPLASAEFLVEAIATGAARDLIFRHEAKGLAGSITIPPTERGPVTVRLEPCGTITGRLLDATGAPLANAELTCQSPFSEYGQQFGSLRERVRTDRDGRFRATGLIPGWKHHFTYWEDRRMAGGQQHNVVGLEAVVVASGATQDLGDVAVAKDP